MPTTSLSPFSELAAVGDFGTLNEKYNNNKNYEKLIFIITFFHPILLNLHNT
jgi:hypothetical protein